MSPAPGCRALRDQRDGLTAQAMQAEIALVPGPEAAPAPPQPPRR
ncbi:MAG: hypothetical protein VKI42_01250 [Synechococcaceae cyanobacterium]|nr:hypothetical protein [Synechococcaceae cyanobacterium]